MKLQASIVPTEIGWTALFVAAGSARIPASRDFASEREAKEWIESEAKAVSAPVEWGVSFT